MFKKARYVLAVYREGSFTKAAESIYISQPCLSAAIKQIEERVGARLFDRSTSFVHPTRIGLEYIKTAQEIVALEDAFALQVNKAQSLLAGRIRVGGSNYVCSYILPQMAEAFLRIYPQIRIELTEGHSSKITEMLRAGELDLIVDSFDCDPEGCIYTPLFSEHILLAVPQDFACNREIREYAAHPEELYLGMRGVDSLKELSIRCFRDEKFILLKPGNSMYEHAVHIFKEGDIAPRIGLSLDQLSTSYFLCAQGGGCAFVTDTVFKYHNFDHSILLYRIANSGRRSFGVAYQKNSYLSEPIKRFVEVAKDRMT